MSNVIFEERTFLSSNGTTRVHCYIWRPDQEKPKGIIQLSHGMCEYAQRYDAWARRFCAAGYIFCGNDHLGHGRTAQNEQELGFTATRGGAALLVEDLHTMTRMMQESFPGLPVVLYGHSMGSFAARAYLTQYGNELAAALISGTAGPEQPTGIARGLARLLVKTKGDHHRSRFLTSLAFGSYNQHFKEEADSRSWLTRVKSIREAYRQDPLCRFVFTAGGYETLFDLLHTVSRPAWAEKVPRELPILLFAGDEDPVGNYGKGVKEIYNRLRKNGCENAMIRLYAGGRHEMHNEENADEVFADLTAFLEGVLT